MELRSSQRLRTDQHQDNWSSIPCEILCLIVGKIVSFADFAVFGSVCRAWRHSRAADPDQHRFGPLYIPGAGHEPRRVTLRDPASGTALALDMPEAAGSRCWGSPFGWIVTYDHPKRRFNLLNPLSGATIGLPDLPMSRSRGLRWSQQLTAFLKANPDSDPDNCLVIVVACRRKLAFVRPRGRLANKVTSKVWSNIYIDDDVYLIDITRCNGNVYGLGVSGSSNVQVFQFEPNHRKPNGRPDPHFVQILNLDLNPREENYYPVRVHEGQSIDNILFERHLVDLNGELCLCVRTFNSYTTIDFKIYKIDLFGPGGFTRVWSLGGRCLFLGNTYSFSCKASYPSARFFEQCGSETREFESNYVFYAYNREWPDPRSLSRFIKRPFDVEVWDMLNSTKVYGRKDSPTSALYGPLWFLPSIK